MATVNETNLTHQEKLDALRKLPPVGRRVVQVLALNYEPLSQQRLLSYLAKIAGRQGAAAMPGYPAALAPHLEPLKKAGIVRARRGQGLVCSDQWRHQAIINAREDRVFLKTAKVLTAAEESRFHYYGRRFSNYGAGLRQLLLAAYGRPRPDEEQVSDLLEQFYNQFGAGDRPPLLELFANPFEPEVLANLREEVQFLVLDQACREPSLCLEAVDPEILAYIDNLDNFPPPRRAVTCYLLALVPLHRGRLATAAARLEEFETRYHYSFRDLRGWLAFLQGNDDQALEYFHRHLEAVRKSTGKRKAVLDDYASYFYLFALLRRGRPEDLEEGLKYLASVGRKSRRDYAAATFRRLQPLFREKLSGSDPETAAEDEEPFVSTYDFYSFTLMELLIFAWEGGRLSPATCAYLGKIATRARENGYHWHAAQAHELLAHFGVDPAENRREAAARCREFGFQVLARLVTRDEPWQRKLRALITLGREEAAAGGDDRQERLIWLLEYDRESDTMEIRPRLQKRTRKGGWTRGRNIALQKLAAAREELPYLTPQDARVCEALELHRAREYRHYYYEKNFYAFDLNRALPALAGHPLLFVPGSGTALEPAELTAEPIEISIRFRRRKGKEKEIVLQMHPLPDPDQDQPHVKVVPAGKNSFRLYHFTRDHLAIGRLLGDGLTAPESALELVRQAVAGLTSRVTVHTEIEMGGDLETVAGDITPHLRLRPHGRGLKVELLVKPLPEGTSYFPPGRGGSTFLADRGRKKVQVERQLQAEKEAAAALVQACPTLANLDDGSHEWLLADPESGLELLAELQELETPRVVEWPQGETLKISGRGSFANLHLQVRKSGDWLQTDGSLQVDEQRVIKLEKLLQGLADDRSRGRFISLDDGSFLALSRDLHDRLRELAACAVGGGRKTRISPLAALPLDDLFQQAAEVRGDRHWQRLQERLREDFQPRLPSTFQGELRPYQVEGFNWLARLSHWGVGACLADDMGLGKTIQALAAILLRAPEGPSLVVCPLSVLANWEEEAQRFTPTLRVVPFGGSGRQQLLDELQPFDLVLCSYGLLQINREMLAGVKWQTVVLDEAQAIKNLGAKRTRAAMNLQAEFRLITTGTPVENHLGELWTLFHFLNPGLLGSLKSFQQRFAVPIEKHRDAAAGKRLRKLIRPFILRRRKTQVLRELPAKTEITLHVEMSPEEVALYEAQRRLALENLAEAGADGAEPGPRHLHILAEIMKLRRLCCNPRLLLPDTGIPSAKLQTFTELLAELLAGGHKVLVFSQFVDHLQIVRKHLEAEKISCQYLDGATPAAERRKRVKAFQSGSGDVFLISLKAGGTGLNLTAADYVIHLDPWWNPAVEDQASDRAHRIGQQRPVTVYRLVMKGTIEERIINLHREKRDLADNLLAGSEMSGKISAAELLALLQASHNRGENFQP